MANWSGLEAFKKTNVHLNVEAMDGSSVFQKDLQKLYFVYVSSKPEDWKFILETRGLGKHVEDFAASEPLHGQHFEPLNLPEIDVDHMDHAFDIQRGPEESAQRAAKARTLLEPEIVEIEGVPMHLTLEEFECVMDSVLPTWVQFRRHSLLPRQEFKAASKMAMYADLLSAKTLAASADTLLSSVQSASIPVKVFASVEKGSVAAAAARAFQKVDGTISYVEPNKLSFRTLDVYNGPVLSARIEERPGYISMAEIGSSEPLEPAAGVACDYAKGVLFDQYSCTAILAAIEKCTSYSQLIKLLLRCGFDLGIANSDSNPRRTGGRCWRIMRGSLVLGVVFDYPGRFGCLRWQPASTDFGQEWGMCCIYRDDTSDIFITCWQLYQLSTSIRQFRAGMLEAGIHTIPVSYSANFVT